MPTIPVGVFDLASIRLPKTTAAFGSHFKATYALTESEEMANWDLFPPYATSSCLVRIGMKRICEGLHGRRLRIHQEFEHERLTRFHVTPVITFAQEVYADLVRIIREWKGLSKLLKKFDEGETDHIMGMHLLQWKSRYIFCLVEDLKALRHGQGEFIEVFKHRW